MTVLRIPTSFASSQPSSSSTAAKSSPDRAARLHTSCRTVNLRTRLSCFTATSTTSHRSSFNASTRCSHSHMLANIHRVSVKWINILRASIKYALLSSGLLNTTFEILYESDVLSVEAFEMWKDSKDVGEGKGLFELIVKGEKPCWQFLFTFRGRHLQYATVLYEARRGQRRRRWRRLLRGWKAAVRCDRMSVDGLR